MSLLSSSAGALLSLSEGLADETCSAACCGGGGGPVCAAPLGYTTGNLYGCSDPSTTRIGNLILEVDAQTTTTANFATWIERWRVVGRAEFALSVVGDSPARRVVGTFVNGDLRSELDVTIAGYGDEDGSMSEVRTLTPAQVAAHVTTNGLYGIDGIGGGVWGFGTGADDPYFDGYANANLNVTSIQPRVFAVGTKLLFWVVPEAIIYTSANGLYQRTYVTPATHVENPPGVTACAPQAFLHHLITGYSNGSFQWDFAFAGISRLHEMTGLQRLSYATCQSPPGAPPPRVDPGVRDGMVHDPAAWEVIRRMTSPCAGCGG